MSEYYVKVKPCCGNCAYQCSIQLSPTEAPRWYCNKLGYNNPPPDEYSCSEFEFNDNILRPSVVRGDYFIKNKEE